MGNGNMDADLPTLDWLAGVLATHADTIEKLKATAQFTMPNSSMQALAAQITEGAAQAFGLIGGNYRQMSEAAKTSRNSYEELDTAFAAQLHRYTDGVQPK
ncbi:hypothetical protein [Nocardia macrotermitis]|uniref:Uncharacterized protein n=1 Tax=Nocardia macrotermitis TaxID=2585198 RepID=A0A7K0DFD9_9NOCA|nr:hypothetical protein [Nocardia macrotermitis]MQY24369.1 hypothetical protein [Nocardia macrotermitis]